MEMHTRLCVPDVVISEDKMTVKMKLCPDDNGQEWTADELISFVVSKGVKTEIATSLICDMIQNEIYNIYMEVAKGKLPVQGTDGYYVYHVAKQEMESTPKELEDGTVQYVRTAKHTVVEEGDLLAEYVPATNGEYGYTVDNAMLAPKRGKDLPMLKGKGFYHEEGKYYAANHGMVEITEKGFRITNLLEVDGNVDINYGHIDFDGNVNIRGDVKSGIMSKRQAILKSKVM